MPETNRRPPSAERVMTQESRSRDQLAARATVRLLSVAEAAERAGRRPETVRRWIRAGRLPAVTEHGRHAIAEADLELVRGGLYPTLELPHEWQRFEDGEPVPNWVAAVSVGRRGASKSAAA